MALRNKKRYSSLYRLKKAFSEPNQNNAMATDFDYRFLWMQKYKKEQKTIYIYLFNKIISNLVLCTIKSCHKTKICPILAVILIIGKMPNL